MTDDASRDAYYAYGVDLIRTAGLLLRTTPSVIYRASLLFQRFEASVDRHFRARYITPRDMVDYRRSLEERLLRAQRQSLHSLASPHSSPHMTESALDLDSAAGAAKAAEYLVPNHAQQEMRTGLVPLVDLRAPLDYCLLHLVDQEDILYLCAACLLIATKMEDPTVRIRAVVNTFMRLSERRAGVVVNEQQRPPPARYEDFKACVVDAEEVVLHQLGFQTFVESPYKYVLLYLNLLVEPADAVAQQDATAQSPPPTPAVSTTTSTPASRLPQRPSPTVTRWMVRAVQLINDFPRCRRLVEVPSDVLALYAIRHTCPPDLALPSGWTRIFGVAEATLKEVAQVYVAYLRDKVGSSRAATALSDLRTRIAATPYRTVKEAQEYEATWRQLREHRQGTSGASSPLTMNNTAAASIEELRDLIGAPFVASPSPAPAPIHAAGIRRDRSDACDASNAAKSSRGEGPR